jgi:hypothetical protein
MIHIHSLLSSHTMMAKIIVSHLVLQLGNQIRARAQFHKNSLSHFSSCTYEKARFQDRRRRLTGGFARKLISQSEPLIPLKYRRRGLILRRPLAPISL